MAGNEYFHMILQRLKIKQTSIFVHVRISNLKRWYLYKRFLYLVHYFIYIRCNRNTYKNDNIIYSLNLHNSICFQSAHICIIKRTTIAYYNVTYEQFILTLIVKCAERRRIKKIRFIKSIHSSLR
jgi:hypothetical protein